MKLSHIAALGFTLAAAACHHSHGAEAGAGPVAAAAPAMPAGVTAQLIAQGDSIYNSPNPQGQPMSCTRCHGAKGDGGQNGPSLTTGPWLHGGRDPVNLARIITNGMPRDSISSTRRFAMNPRGGQQANLSDAQIRALAAYVWSISANKTAQ
jgi:mono/diheme cytochrome c family protein